MLSHEFMSNKNSTEKTNAMRALDRSGVHYESYCYLKDGKPMTSEEAPSGTEVAAFLGLDERKVFKTLVTEGKTLGHYVFVIPVARELDLKKAAAAVGEKSVEMLKSKNLLPLTGYVHGGCSPVGMKKQFPTVVDASAKECDTIIFSAGKIGYQVEIHPDDLSKVIPFKYSDLTRD